MKTRSKRRIEIGDIFYLFGYGVKLEVIANPDDQYPTCKVLEITKYSRFRVGQVKRFTRKGLYPRKAR